MSESAHNQPYKTLGLRLKMLREKLNMSLSEVSDAVEINPDLLTRIEEGKDCPAEDVFLLLMAYLKTPDEEAAKLWDLAGYSKEPTQTQNILDDIAAAKPIVMLMQPDNRIIYTDAVNATVNSRGVVMNFLQDHGQGRHVSVSRVGMSKDQAQNVIEVLQKTLGVSNQKPKSLPAPNKNDIKKDSIWLKRNDQTNEQQ